MTTRTFEDRPAVRERVPLLLGLMGPSGGGKTFSALRLATGIQAVSGGEIFMVDTEARRGLHYASEFNFRHMPFGAPFGALDYLAAINHCVDKGAGVVIVDSMSHEHEGPGGLLEVHASETKRLAKSWGVSEAKAQMSAWAKPKADRRRLINTILQLPCNFIFCFRAKHKLKIKKGEDPKPLGFMPIAGEEFVYEQAVCALLMPGANGVPTWRSDEDGEAQMIKLPGWARAMFADGRPIDEGAGTKLAQWAAGTVVRSTAELLAALDVCDDPATLGTLKTEARASWKSTSKADRERITKAIAEATERLSAADPPPADDVDESNGRVRPEDEPSDAQLGLEE